MKKIHYAGDGTAYCDGFYDRETAIDWGKVTCVKCLGYAPSRVYYWDKALEEAAKIPDSYGGHIGPEIAKKKN